MMFQVRRVAAVCLLLGVVACGGNPAPPGGLTPPVQEAPPSDRLVAKEADVEVSVDELAPASARVDSIVGATGGLVESSRVTGDNQIELELRVPAPALDTMLAGLRTLGSVDRELVSTSDVTVEVVDLEARLRNLEAVRDRLLTYLDEAQNVDEVISVERELTRVQSQIDSINGRLQLLRSQAAMSVVDLRLKRKRTLGPLSAVGSGAWWVVKKLFILDE